MAVTPSNANTSGMAPCPFCGGEAWLNDYEAKHSDLPPMSRAPQCRSCGASLGYLTTPAKATEAWNRRVTAAPASPLPGGGTTYAAGGLDVLSRIRSRLNEQIDRAEADLNSTVTIRLNDAKAIRHMLAPAAPTGDA